jgi:hypothetical protein
VVIVILGVDGVIAVCFWGCGDCDFEVLRGGDRCFIFLEKTIFQPLNLFFARLNTKYSLL